MKVISKEEEAAHYNAVLKGGFIGGSLGLGLGLIGVIGASKRYPAFKQLTLPFRSFLVTSSTTFGAIINAERWSNDFHKQNNPMNFYKDEATRALEAVREQESSSQRIHKEEYEGQDLWMDMVAAEERRIAAKKAAAQAQEQQHEASKVAEQ